MFNDLVHIGVIHLGTEFQYESQDPFQEFGIPDADLENGVVPFPVGIATFPLHYGRTEPEHVAAHNPDDFLDHFESKLEMVDGSKDYGPGVLQWSGDQDYPGFRLDLGGQLVHQAGFARV